MYTIGDCQTYGGDCALTILNFQFTFRLAQRRKQVQLDARLSGQLFLQRVRLLLHRCHGRHQEIETFARLTRS